MDGEGGGFGRWYGCSEKLIAPVAAVEAASEMPKVLTWQIRACGVAVRALWKRDQSSRSP